MKKLLILLLLLYGCSTTAIQIVKAPALDANAGVTIFMSESEVKKPFVVVGTIAHYDWGKYQRLTLEDAVPVLKEKARSFGGNGIIIDKNKAVYSGIFSRGVDIGARVILIK